MMVIISLSYITGKIQPREMFHKMPCNMFGRMFLRFLFAHHPILYPSIGINFLGEVSTRSEDYRVLLHAYVFLLGHKKGRGIL